MAINPRIELLNGQNKYGDFWSHGPSPLHISFTNRNSWFKDLSYEAPIVGILESERYGFFLDVGAGWGYHTIIAAHHCRSVVALEANALRFGLLCWNTQMLPNVCRHLCFAGREGQKAKRSRAPWNPVEARDPEVELSAVTLDGILRQHADYPLVGEPGLVKIDVEGSELDVLAGAKGLLADDRFDWIVEIHTRMGVTFDAVDLAMGNRIRENLSAKHAYYRTGAESDE